MKRANKPIKYSTLLRKSKLPKVKSGGDWFTNDENGRTIGYCAVAALAKELFPKAKFTGLACMEMDKTRKSVLTIVSENTGVPENILWKASDKFAETKSFQKAADILESHGY